MAEGRTYLPSNVVFKKTNWLHGIGDSLNWLSSVNEIFVVYLHFIKLHL